MHVAIFNLLIMSLIAQTTFSITGAVPALAFLSIMAQTTAAPLAPSTTEPDVLDLLEHFRAKHLILFDGVDNPGLDAAFGKMAARGRATLHMARIRSDSDKPGTFYVAT